MSRLSIARELGSDEGLFRSWERRGTIPRLEALPEARYARVVRAALLMRGDGFSLDDIQDVLNPREVIMGNSIEAPATVGVDAADLLSAVRAGRARVSLFAGRGSERRIVGEITDADVLQELATTYQLFTPSEEDVAFAKRMRCLEEQTAEAERGLSESEAVSLVLDQMEMADRERVAPLGASARRRAPQYPAHAADSEAPRPGESVRESLVRRFNAHEAECRIAGRPPLTFSDWLGSDRVLHPTLHERSAAEGLAPRAAIAVSLSAARKG